MHRNTLKYLLLLLLLPVSSIAQVTISGRILNYNDKKPVANADVFLNNATVGTNSGADGYFKLYNVRGGKYFLIVSVVGYNDFSERVQVENSEVKLNDIYLTPSNKTLKEVVVRPKEIRYEYLDVFKQQFLGSSELAHDCRIINPERLNISFSRADSTYTATSDGYLVIENPDIGYRIKYELLDFYYRDNIDSPVIKYHGYVHFEQMAGKPADIRHWEKRRYEAYKNSAMHFYRALVADRLDDEGFKVQQYITYENPDRPVDSIVKKKIEHYKYLLTEDEGPIRDTLKFWLRAWKEPHLIYELRTYPLEQRDLLFPTEQPNLFAFGCDFDHLFITYKENKQFDGLKLEHIRKLKNTECTLISFNTAFAFIDRYGSLTDPYDVAYMGVWKNERTADLLPVDYEPPGSN